jgi:hypothetical protein
MLPEKFLDFDSGKKVDKALAAAITAQSHEKAESGGDASMGVLPKRIWQNA